jgi:hypothetical protein
VAAGEAVGRDFATAARAGAATGRATVDGAVFERESLGGAAAPFEGGDSAEGSATTSEDGNSVGGAVVDGGASLPRTAAALAGGEPLGTADAASPPGR